MVAPNQLILSGNVVVSPSLDHFGKNFTSNGGSFSITGGTSVVNKDSITTNNLNVNLAVVSNSGTFNQQLTSAGTLTVAGATTLNTLSAANTVFNGSVTLGTILLTNGQVKVNNSYVNNDAMSSPYGTFTNATIGGSLAVGTVNATFSNYSNDTWQRGGNFYMVSGSGVIWRNGSNSQTAVNMVLSNGLFYCNLYNNDGTFRTTLWRVSAGEGTSEPNVTIGTSMIVSGSVTTNNDMTASGNIRSKGSTTVDAGLTVGGSTYMQSLDVANVNMRNTSRVMNASAPASGTMYFGNGDKMITWDSSNWVIRGGALFASNFVADNTLTVLGYAGFNSNVGISGNLAVTGESYGTRLRASGEIKSDTGNFRSRGLDGYADRGRYWFGDGGAAITFDGNAFLFSHQVYMIDQNLTARTGVFQGSLYVRNSGLGDSNNLRGTIYFGKNNAYNIEYDGGNTINFSSNQHVLGSFFADGNVNAGDYVNCNRVQANYIGSSGTIAAGYFSTTGAIYAGGNFEANEVKGRTAVRSAYVESTGDSYTAGNHTVANIVYGRNGARFNNEVWVDNGGNFSRIVVGQGRGWMEWNGDRFQFNGSVYGNSGLTIETEVHAYNALRTGRWGGGSWSAVMYGDGGGGGKIDTANGNLQVQRLTANYLGSLGDLVVNGQSYTTGFTRAKADLFVQTWGGNPDACVMITGSSDGTGIINTGNSNLLTQYNYAFGYYNRSDERLKNITPFMTNADALSKILRINPIQFTWKDPAMGSNSFYGFSAQQVESVDDMLVLDATDKNEDSIKHVSTLEMIPLLVASIKELQREINELKNKA